VFRLSEPLEGESEIVVSSTIPIDPFTRAMDKLIAMFEEISGHQGTPEGNVGDPEVLFFKLGPAGDHGEPTPGDALFEGEADGPVYGIRGTLSHEVALNKYGYTVDWNGQKGE
jgi:hypothetical protein